jgi:hypothetical protein
VSCAGFTAVYLNDPLFYNVRRIVGKLVADISKVWIRNLKNEGSVFPRKAECPVRLHIPEKRILQATACPRSQKSLPITPDDLPLSSVKTPHKIYNKVFFTKACTDSDTLSSAQDIRSYSNFSSQLRCLIKLAIIAKSNISVYLIIRYIVTCFKERNVVIGVLYI